MDDNLETKQVDPHARQMEQSLFYSSISAFTKYVYFLNAASGAGIAFAIQQTNDGIISWPIAILGMAVAAWAACFYCGCQIVDHGAKFLLLNFRHSAVRTGTIDPLWTPDEINAYIQQNGVSAKKFVTWQFRLFIAGAVLFVAWHITAMYQRTPERPTQPPVAAPTQ